LVGRVGEDEAADGLLLALAAAGVGHVAVLRTGGAATPRRAATGSGDEASPAAAAFADGEAGETPPPIRDGLPLDGADVELALRYLPDYGVLVAGPGLDAPALAMVADAAGWSGARLIVVIDADAVPADLPSDATVLELPADADDDAFAAVVARYAVELDRGTEPGAAFAVASSGSGWSSVSD
jgi:hypothetical protein